MYLLLEALIIIIISFINLIIRNTSFSIIYVSRLLSEDLYEICPRVAAEKAKVLQKVQKIGILIGDTGVC
jgi:hypothetical protein